MTDRPHLLSKSRFMAGLPRLQRLYIESNHSDLDNPIGLAQQAIFDAGCFKGNIVNLEQF